MRSHNGFGNLTLQRRRRVIGINIVGSPSKGYPLHDTQVYLILNVHHNFQFLNHKLAGVDIEQCAAQKYLKKVLKTVSIMAIRFISLVI